jgi:hypothetical protein
MVNSEAKGEHLGFKKKVVWLEHVLGVRKIGRNPRTQGHKNNESGVQFAKDWETRNLQKSALTSKVVNPFTRAHAPPFIERRKDFLHFETTLEFREYS